MSGAQMPGQGPEPGYTVVVPTIGRPSLLALLRSLATSAGPPPREVILVDDRAPGDRAASGDLPVGDALSVGDARPVGDAPSVGDLLPVGESVPVRVLTTAGGRGPAAARNVGWRAARTEWVAFLDDDVVVPPDWRTRLAADLSRCGPRVGGSAARIVVPLPQGRAPTDWERCTAGLEAARWATADMAYRRQALDDVGGFDERFPRAYREDADLALRVREQGWVLTVGSRAVRHPVRPAGFWISVRTQRGNADDALMRRLHGPRWRERSGAFPGRRPRHVVVTAAGLGAVLAVGSGARRTAAGLATVWLAGTAEFALRRIAPGPREPGEVFRMLVTSAVIPPAATWHAAHGAWRHRHARPWRGTGPDGATGTDPRAGSVAREGSVRPSETVRPEAVLFDRDGTLVHDVPFNGDPDRVRPVPGAAEALTRLRSAGIRTGVVTNQSGIARGLLTAAEVSAVNARVEALLGPFDVWEICPHDDADGCGCRKPAPGMVLAAARRLGVDPRRVAVVGDIGRDMAAAAAAGARGLLVPTSVTDSDEVRAAAEVAASLPDAVERLLAGRP